ncbi:retrovirus-related pol polyprotein [Lentinula edodes]|uniref:Retrovirus-related pol polyprotein n=1 Tax=Lentinula edodes TaxID=5353 RepID=A0A1Q3EJ67_LENED|nr:retrovirus-related pol polyprotein [Lentinula edodes]
MESIRLVLAIVAVLQLSIFQVNFAAAFLNSPITHNVYMKQPEGFLKPGSEHLVCKLRKSIYGTMQGSHDWQETLATGYAQDGYTASRADPCIQYQRVGGEYTITSTYGDDVCGGSPMAGGRNKTVADLGGEQSQKRGSTSMNITQNPESKAITISQKTYFKRMLANFGLEHVRCRNTPLPPNVRLTESLSLLPDEEAELMRDKPYGSIVGCILWGEVCT